MRPTYLDMPREVTHDEPPVLKAEGHDDPSALMPGYIQERNAAIKARDEAVEQVNHTRAALEAAQADLETAHRAIADLTAEKEALASERSDLIARLHEKSTAHAAAEAELAALKTPATEEKPKNEAPKPEDPPAA